MINTSNLLSAIFIGVTLFAPVYFIIEFVVPKIRNDYTNMQSYEISDFKENIEKNKKINDTIAKVFEVEDKNYNIQGIEVFYGDKISFQMEEKNINGEFIGVKCSEAEGYSKHFIIKCTDNRIIAAPIEHIAKDSLIKIRS